MKDTKIFNKLQKTRGDIGEDIAVKFLKNKGFEIIDRNYRTRNGEIDIIAKDKDSLVFIEVKFRKNAEFGQPYEFVDKKKKNKLIKAIKYYLLKKHLHNINYRLDIVSIVEQPDLQIDHFENITENF